MLGRVSQVLVVMLGLLLLGQQDSNATQEQAQVYYLSPTGNNSNAGTLTSPWQTLAYALTQLSAGDILNLREGTYYEHEIKVSLVGTASAPITIRSYPGEQAIIDGGSANDIRWELDEAANNLYRSQQNFSDEDHDFVRAWLVDDDMQLVEYESTQNLESLHYGPLNGLTPTYIGPGLQIRNDGYIYIRLAQNPNDLVDAEGSVIAPIPTNLNPNDNNISLSFSKYILLLEGSSYLHFNGIRFSHARYIMDVRNSHHITLNDCRFDYGTVGIVIRENIHSWEIANCEFNNGLPDYVHWTDVKNRTVDVVEAYPEFQSVAISGLMSGFNIHHNLFRDSFDGIRVDAGTTASKITDNIFINMRDDSINLSRAISNVEVAHNIMWHVMGGISNLGSNEPPGHVYIHHNVIDNSAYQRGGRVGNYREGNWPIWTIGKPFPAHDDDNKTSWWKLYNNTIITRLDTGHRWAAAGPDQVTGNPEKYIYNNIFYVFDERVIFRNDLKVFGSHYDGNVFYRQTPGDLPPFTDFYDGGRYNSLAEFQTITAADWEVNALEIDPEFDLTAINNPIFDPDNIWERYRPTNPLVFTVGASYCAVDWPETAGISYRGALPPSTPKEWDAFKFYLPLQTRH